ncbi:MAG: FadR family transcriptional regulator [Rhodocyclaceae bacterium]|nr:FadR family transcriptional regulator [Rhodocyclaceae bacterium]
MASDTLIARPPKLADAVSASLQDRISAGELVPGDRLPTEKQMCDRFGVSRAVVREAIARLKADGYVETHQGLGAFVAKDAGRTNFRLVAPGSAAGPVDLAQVFELRLVTEAGVAQMAALRRTREDLAAMRGPLAQMDEALRSGDQASEADDAFHRAVASATHNPLVERFMAFMNAQVRESRVPTWDHEGHALGRAAAAQAEHVAMFDAIAAGDAAAARRAAEQHLTAAASRLEMTIGGQEPTGRVTNAGE